MSGARMMALVAGAAAGAVCATPEARAEIEIRDKTLVAWVSVTDLAQRGGAVISIGGVGELFDAIVFGEIEPGRWMAGSDFFRRTEQQQQGWPSETAAPGELVQVAISYAGRDVTVYRNAELYASYTIQSDPAVFTSASPVLLGLRHLGAGNGYFRGEVEDARIYAEALDAEALARLRPDEPSTPKPVGWWTFEGGSLTDRMGNFPEGRLLGGAHVADGRLILDGSGCLLVKHPPEVDRARESWPIYHITALPDEGICAPYDANGAIYWKGRYHLMYIVQEPDGVHKWGHLSSTDLVNWTYHPIALAPSPGDRDTGIFSGNAFVNKDGVPMLCWMGVDAGVCVATALDDDLIRWRNHPNNPIIPMPKEGDPNFGRYIVWDPYLWLEGDTYMCLLGGNRLPNGRDTLYLCTSPDLVEWTPRGSFYEGDPDWRREDEDCSCPDFFPLDGKHVLLCISHAVGARCYVGDFDRERFHPERHVRMNWPGGMFFAPESLVDGRGRRIVWAWVTDPRIQPAQRRTGSGFMSLPRVLSLAEDGTLLIRPAEELEALRGEPTLLAEVFAEDGREADLEGLSGRHLEIRATIDRRTARRVGLKVMRSPGGEEWTGVWFDVAAGELVVDMSHSSLREDVTYGSPPFASYGLQRAVDNPHPYREVRAPFALGRGEPLELRVFLDGPMLEVFANDRQCVTQVLFPSREDAIGVRFVAEGGRAVATRIEAWPMRPARFVDARQ